MCAIYAWEWVLAIFSERNVDTLEFRNSIVNYTKRHSTVKVNQLNVISESDSAIRNNVVKNVNEHHMLPNNLICNKEA